MTDTAGSGAPANGAPTRVFLWILAVESLAIAALYMLGRAFA